MTHAVRSSISARLFQDPFEREVILAIGGVEASAQPIVIRTLLGSCVAVCLYDPAAHVGGMNHFLLPEARGDHADSDAGRFGVYAMDRLIGAVMKAGGMRSRLIAKVFGAAHVLDTQNVQSMVPEQNIQFVRNFLETEQFPVHAEDLGGDQPREVYLHTGAGQVFVRKVCNDKALQRLIARERRTKAQPRCYGDVTLFDL